MRRLRVKLAIGVAAVGVVVITAAAVAGDRGRVRTTLTGYEETPQAISTTGNGTFRATISGGGDAINYELRYADLEGGAVQQAHIHFGQEAISGGISAFLCSNLGNGPAGTQACPAAPARITGTITAADVIGPTGQGIAPGELDELISAIRAGFAYANVHTATYPGGEIRGQFDGDDDDDHDHDR
jgi:CHRD domain-containing protein